MGGRGGERLPEAERHPIQGNVPKARILQELVGVLLEDPPVPPNATCAAPPVPVPLADAAGGDLHFCSGRGTGLKSPARKTPRKIGHMVMFGFEPDTLEVLLREEMDVVDYIFIVEAQLTHQKEVRKPLMWEALKHSERFASFVDPDKVVHIVVDEAASAEAQKDQKTFKMEKVQTRLGVERIREWVKNTQGLGPDDVFISGDADEVLSRESLNLLRWCDFQEQVIAGSLWMPMGALNRAFRTDWPVMGLPRTFAMPTIYEWRVVYAGIEDGARHFTRQTGAQGRTWKYYLLGGLHMTGISFLPHALIKELTASSYKGRQEHLDQLAGGEVRDLDKAQIELYNLGGQFKHWKPRTVALNRVQAQERAAVGYVPWFLRCNPARFPYWFGNPDPRNKLLLQALQRLQELPVVAPRPTEAPPPGPEAAAGTASAPAPSSGAAKRQADKADQVEKPDAKARVAVAAAQKREGVRPGGTGKGTGKGELRGGPASAVSPPPAAAAGQGVLLGVGLASPPPAGKVLSPSAGAAPPTTKENLVEKGAQTTAQPGGAGVGANANTSLGALPSADPPPAAAAAAKEPPTRAA